MSYEVAGNEAVQDLIEDQVYHTHIAGAENVPHHHHRMNAHDLQQENDQQIANALYQQQQIQNEEEEDNLNQRYHNIYNNNPENINYELALKLFQQIPSSDMDSNSQDLMKQLEERLKIISSLDAQEQELIKKKSDSEYQLRKIEQNQLKASQNGRFGASSQLNNQNNNNNNNNANSGNILENRSLVNSYVIQNSSQLDAYGNFNTRQSGQKLTNQGLGVSSSAHPIQPFSQASGKYGIAAALKNVSMNSPNNLYGSKNNYNSFNVREEMKCTFHPIINKKSEKMAKRNQGDKDYSVKYLYQDFLQRQEKEKFKKEQEFQQVKAQMVKPKIDPKSQKIIVKKIDKILSFIINNVQEGDYISYENLGFIYQEIGLFRALQFQKDQNQTSLYLKDRKNIDMNRMQAEMQFHEQSFRILNLNNAEQGVSKKLALDVFMVLLEKKFQNSQAEAIFKDILINTLQINQASDNEQQRLAILQEYLQESIVPQDGISSGESWDIGQLIQAFRKLHDDKTSLMEWYSSKNNNILNDIKFISDQDNNEENGNTNLQNQVDGKQSKPNANMRNSMTNAELKFHPQINKKSKLLDSCLMMSQSGQYFTKAQTTKNQSNSNPIDNFSSELSLGQKNGQNNKQENSKKRYEILYEHSKYLQEKKKEQKEIIQKEQTDKCTFKPSVNLKSSAIYASKILIEGGNQQANDLKKSVYEKLYEKHTVREEELNMVRSKVKELREKQEELECTFRPNINYAIPQMKSPDEGEKLNNVKGAQQIFERYQKARAQQQEKDSFFERQRLALSQNASRFTETQPFSFDQNNQLNSMNRLGNQSTRKEREIIGNVDVNFSKGKKGRIIIYKGDNPDELALNFAKIYSLNDEMRFTLKEMISEYIQKIENENSSSDSEQPQQTQQQNQPRISQSNQNEEYYDDQKISNKSVRGETEEDNPTSEIESIENNTNNQNSDSIKDVSPNQIDLPNSSEIAQQLIGLQQEGENQQEQ